jgi:hypothetical protein
MSGGSAESWARLRLVQGDSSAQAWELVASRGQTILTVGSGPSASWQVHGEGVLPVHFSLHWDGTLLRIADLEDSRDLRLDGTPVGGAWRTVAGHARLEFGQAVIMVDTSSTARAGESDHPLEPGSLPPASLPPGEPASGAIPRLHKATLLGIVASGGPPVVASVVKPGAELPAPLNAGTSPASAAPISARDSAPPAGGSDYPGATGGFRVSRFSDSERARKATLLGAAISVPPPAPLPGAKAGASTPSRGLSTGTLLGVVNPLDVRLSRLSGASADPAGNNGDVRTIIGMPMPDSTIRQGIALGVTQQDVPAPAKGERIASTWQEDAGSERPSLPPEPIHRPSPTPSARVGSDPGGRFGPGAQFEARRPKRSFPLQYLGIVVLTCAAYFAWLYLLDHW